MYQYQWERPSRGRGRRMRRRSLSCQCELHGSMDNLHQIPAALIPVPRAHSPPSAYSYPHLEDIIHKLTSSCPGLGTTGRRRRRPPHQQMQQEKDGDRPPPPSDFDENAYLSGKVKIVSGSVNNPAEVDYECKWGYRHLVKRE